MGLDKFSKTICCICGEEITESHFIDPYGRPACKHHSNTQCYSCGRFCNPNNSVSVDRFGYLCPHCMERIPTEESIKRIAKFVNDFYYRENFRIPAYELISLSPIEMAKHRENINAIGLATYEYNCKSKNEKKYTVYILSQLSRTKAASVIAHEVLHLWQYEYSVNAPNNICEGLCNLGSYLLLQYINREESVHIGEALLHNSDPIYGQGFRDMKALYDQGGWSRIREFLKKYRE